MLANILSQYWWVTLLRGVLWIAFGIVVLAQPAISLVALTLMFGAFTLADGVAGVVSAIAGRKEHENWGVLLLAGLCGVGVGLLTFASPAVTALVLVFYIAIWTLTTGVLELVVAIRLRKEIAGEPWMALAGVASIAAGAYLIARPGVGALAVLWLIAGYTIVLGATLVALAFKTRGFLTRLGAASV